MDPLATRAHLQALARAPVGLPPSRTRDQTLDEGDDRGAGNGRDAFVAAVGELEDTVTYRLTKRMMDIIAAVVGLALLAPVMSMIAVLVRATSSGPAIFRQARVGCGGQPFVLLKFRTMRADCDDRIHREYVTKLLTARRPIDGGAPGIYKLDRDPRVIPLGAWLRRTSLDELPQLLNVLRGEMSLVGPRPGLAWEVELYEPHQRDRLLVKPGLVGLPQVSGRNRLSMRASLDLDAEYVRRRSLRLDLQILLRTPRVVVAGTDAR